MSATVTEFKVLPAPSFSSTVGGPSLATIYGGHFDRLTAVVAAARTGNSILIRLALDYHDKHGCGE